MTTKRQLADALNKAMASRQKPPAIDRIAAMYAGFISAGFTLHIVNGAIDIQPSDRVTEAARQQVAQHEAELIAHLRTLPQRKEASKTVEAPPHRLIVWVIKTLQARIAKGDMPPDGWMEWLETVDKALIDSETVRIEILAATDIDSFIAKVF